MNHPFHKLRFTTKILFIVFAVELVVLCNAHSQNATSALPEISKTVVVKRLSELDKATPIQLDYNQSVQAYIDVYTIKRRDHLSNIIGRSSFYFPIFEAALDKSSRQKSKTQGRAKLSVGLTLAALCGAWGASLLLRQLSDAHGTSPVARTEIPDNSAALRALIPENKVIDLDEVDIGPSEALASRAPRLAWVCIGGSALQVVWTGQGCGAQLLPKRALAAAMQALLASPARASHFSAATL